MLFERRAHDYRSGVLVPLLKEVVGSQDQVMAAYGGLRHISFLPHGEISVCPLTIGLDRIKDLNAHLMLFYTGIQRVATDVLEEQVGPDAVRRNQRRPRSLERSRQVRS